LSLSKRLRPPSLAHNAGRIAGRFRETPTKGNGIRRGQRPRLQFLSPLEIEKAPVIYLAVKSWCLAFLACGIVAFSGCATDEEFNATEAAKTGEAVPGEVNPNAPDASQQTQTKPGFRF
jgi:hypothetical protein